MTDFKQELDMRNLSCPMPVMKAKKALKLMASGEVLYVVATDPASVDDFATLIDSTGDTMVEQSEARGEYNFYIQKA